jgi:hypothetical protein
MITALLLYALGTVFTAMIFIIGAIRADIRPRTESDWFALIGGVVAWPALWLVWCVWFCREGKRR